GITWKKILYRDENTGATDVVLDPKEPNVVFAALYQRQRKGWGFNGGGPGSGIFRSVDNGATWTELKNGLPRGDKGRTALAMPAAAFGTFSAACMVKTTPCGWIPRTRIIWWWAETAACPYPSIAAPPGCSA